MALTVDDLINAGIELSDDNGLYELSALEWIGNNTNIPVSTPADLAALSASAKLFIQEYVSIMGLPSAVSSESIEGMSQTYSGGYYGGIDKGKIILNLARSLLGKSVNSSFKFIPASRGWKYGC